MSRATSMSTPNFCTNNRFHGTPEEIFENLRTFLRRNSQIIDIVILDNVIQDDIVLALRKSGRNEISRHSGGNLWTIVLEKDGTRSDGIHISINSEKLSERKNE